MQYRWRHGGGWGGGAYHSPSLACKSMINHLQTSYFSLGVIHNALVQIYHRSVNTMNRGNDGSLEKLRNETKIMGGRMFILVLLALR